ncbi:conserved hypothetical protein [Beggiatoa sp. PS]|nr:conserved hypothetical protein [Beggiatoa sp. PS]
MFCIYNCDGDENLLYELEIRLKADLQQRPKIIGIVLDADIPENQPNLMARWQQLTDKIRKYNYILPQPDKQGTIISPNIDKYPRLGIWLMPNNQDTGMLEDFLKQLAIPETLATAQSCVKCAQRRKVTHFKEAHVSKAELYTYLAWQDEPGKPDGMAITAHALQPDTEIAHLFTAWLKKLFNKMTKD